MLFRGVNTRLDGQVTFRRTLVLLTSFQRYSRNNKQYKNVGLYMEVGFEQRSSAGYCIVRNRQEARITGIADKLH